MTETFPGFQYILEQGAALEPLHMVYSELDFTSVLVMDSLHSLRCNPRMRCSLLLTRHCACKQI